ncbi:Serine/threonine protein kinase Ppk235 / FY16936)) [Taphrina deformans PYCC 5710]|uniref:cyclin-dependent kinase n=1 Tax=Taphrina deformans (strain PYCC 5710 / ATCC 11124 / CBS 356.35 / IMI 108563 / JCM 9778 / NBRC 8474) TaxID=1097556 RepID=R4XB05_TAPDE|nr:Serine/threonine protein kinase Ppk235 / FY16936)) [Taphrina deformans PYCC 5710]|eukprot:CCG83054.1 Serine/threonine protein kinase Ppk235 / FY16936)) [Taphrina deformans PYCC 5710]
MELTSISHGTIHLSNESIQGDCVSLDAFEYLNQLGEGTYGVVHRARDKRNDNIVALKTVRIFESEKGEGIPITALREISILRSLNHINVIKVLEVAVGTELDEIFMVEDLKFQVHKQRIIHRDLKMSNLLLTKTGILKIADFGMAREKAGWMTPQPVTIWYRSPELLFGAQTYSYSVDLWSAGCIMAELITSQPLLPGSNEKQEMDLIVSLLGPPSETTWPGYKRLPWAHNYSAPDPGIVRKREGLKAMFQAEKSGLVDILIKLVQYNPESRPSAKEALNHRYFYESPPG